MKIKLKLKEIFNFSEMESSNYCSGTCATVSYKGDGYCDDENNNCGCEWDGGDCCGSNVNTQLCSGCECLDPNYSKSSNNLTFLSKKYFALFETALSIFKEYNLMLHYSLNRNEVNATIVVIIHAIEPQGLYRANTEPNCFYIILACRNFVW